MCHRQGEGEGEDDGKSMSLSFLRGRGGGCIVVRESKGKGDGEDMSSSSLSSRMKVRVGVHCRQGEDEGKVDGKGLRAHHRHCREVRVKARCHWREGAATYHKWTLLTEGYGSTHGCRYDRDG